MLDASTLTRDLLKAFRLNENVDKAEGMRAYMRNQFVYFGIPGPLRNELQRDLIANVSDIHQAFDVAEMLWEQEQRECQYTACDVLAHMARRKTVPLFDPENLLWRTQQLIRSKSWWDTVDALAPNVAGVIVKRSDVLDVETVAREWIVDRDFWIQRSALLLQLKYKADTNADLLFELVLAVAHSNEFFLRKGAGWVLREYSKTNPTAVRAFVDQNQHVLSSLTIREGTKYC